VAAAAVHATHHHAYLDRAVWTFTGVNRRLGVRHGHAGEHSLIPRLLQAFLFGVGAAGPLTFGAVALTLGVIALASARKRWPN
jgi:hypothetical protein